MHKARIYVKAGVELELRTEMIQTRTITLAGKSYLRSKIQLGRILDEIGIL